MHGRRQGDISALCSTVMTVMRAATERRGAPSEKKIFFFFFLSEPPRHHPPSAPRAPDPENTPRKFPATIGHVPRFQKFGGPSLGEVKATKGGGGRPVTFGFPPVLIGASRQRQRHEQRQRPPTTDNPFSPQSLVGRRAARRRIERHRQHRSGGRIRPPRNLLAA